MNGLSWFLYFAELLPRLGSFSMLLGLLVLILWAARVALLKAEEYPFEGVITGKVPPKYSMVGIGLSFVLVALLIPSKDTIYLIAGSQAGEAVVTSAAGQEIVDDIQQIIKHQLGTLKGDK